MQKKTFDKIKKDIKTNYKIYILYIVLIVVTIVPLNYYIYSPGGLIDLTDRIKVDNAYPSKGSFNLTYVSTRRATLLTYGLSYLVSSWDLDKIDNRKIDDESYNNIEEREEIHLKETSYDAIIAAFKEAGKEYSIKNVDITVTHVFDYAETDIEVGDIIKTVNGIKVSEVEDITNALNNVNENDEINVEVVRNNKNKTCIAKVKVMEDRKVIGIWLSLLKDVETTPKVEYVFKKRERGSSRGLMSALDIYNKITESDLTHGDIISGTGTIDEDGMVYEIDGVEYKLAGAVREKAKVFIVPIENYEEAIEVKNKKNYDIEIIKVETLHEAVEALNNR